MASFIYNSALFGVVRGTIDLGRGPLNLMLCTANYKASGDHSGRSDVTDEVVGDGYSPKLVDVTMVKDRHHIDVLLGGASWSNATIKARFGVYYSRGGELIAVIDFGRDVVSTDGTFSLSASTLRFQQ